MHEIHDVRCTATASTEKTEANVNALVKLDFFAHVVPLAMDDLLREDKAVFCCVQIIASYATVKNCRFFSLRCDENDVQALLPELRIL